MSYWRTAHASTIGLAHINQQTECQDRFRCETIKTRHGDVLVAVVADGAGSTSDGQIGAEIACDAFVGVVDDFLKSGDATVESLNHEFGRYWVTFVQKRIAERATEAGKEIRDFASTVVGAVAGEGSAVFFQIGDGGSVYSVSGEPASYAFAIDPEESEYVNVTHFVTDETALSAIRFKRVDERIEDLILFSDGIFSVAVDFLSNKPHEPFLRPMIAPLRNLAANGNGLNEKLDAFLGSPKINEKTDDDKTIILASRAAQTEASGDRSRSAES